MERQRLKLSLNRRTNPRMAGEKRRRQPNGRQFFERNFRMFLQCQRIDILFRNKKQHLVSARAQHFSDGKSREKVSASSSACDDGVHRIVDGSMRVGGSAAPRAMQKNMRF